MLRFFIFFGAFFQALRRHITPEYPRFFYYMVVLQKINKIPVTGICFGCLLKGSALCHSSEQLKDYYWM